MVDESSNSSECELFLALASSVESDEAVRMMGIAGEISAGPGEPSSVTGT